jgi:hypothetical protein
VTQRRVAAPPVVDDRDVHEQVGIGLCPRRVVIAVNRSFSRLLKQLSVGALRERIAQGVDAATTLRERR